MIDATTFFARRSLRTPRLLLPAFDASMHIEFATSGGPSGTESGWGINFAQSGDFIFATFFYGRTARHLVYRAAVAGQPTTAFARFVYVMTDVVWLTVFVPVPGNVRSSRRRDLHRDERPPRNAALSDVSSR
jgi:hypothetical protein